MYFLIKTGITVYKLKEKQNQKEFENPDIHTYHSDNPDMATEPTDTLTKKNTSSKSEVSSSTDTSSGNTLLNRLHSVSI